MIFSFLFGFVSFKRSFQKKAGRRRARTQAFIDRKEWVEAQSQEGLHSLSTKGRKAGFYLGERHATLVTPLKLNFNYFREHLAVMNSAGEKRFSAGPTVLDL